MLGRAREEGVHGVQWGVPMCGIAWLARGIWQRGSDHGVQQMVLRHAMHHLAPLCRERGGPKIQCTLDSRLRLILSIKCL